MQQLRTWFRNNAKKGDCGKGAIKEEGGRPQATLWNGKTRQRAPHLVELYQRMYPDRVSLGLKTAGFDKDHATDIDWVAENGEEPSGDLKRKLQEQKSARMSARRSVSMQLLAAETDDVKKAVEEELKKIQASKLEPKEKQPLTPESAQR
jgi:hypothetical protein